MFLLLEGPDVLQRGISLVSESGLPETLVAGAVVGYVAGLAGNTRRPRRWLAVGVWLGGWAVGLLVIMLYAYLTRPIPA